MKINFPLKRSDFYLIPVSVFIFIYIYYFSLFYFQNFNELFLYISPSINKYDYEKVQALHPYSEIYNVAKKYRNHQNKIYFVTRENYPKNYDYTSSYLLKKRNIAKNEAYLSEAEMVTDYFFYPKEVIHVDVPALEAASLGGDDLIISDSSLENVRNSGKYFRHFKSIDSIYNQINKVEKDQHFIYLAPAKP